MSFSPNKPKTYLVALWFLWLLVSSFLWIVTDYGRDIFFWIAQAILLAYGFGATVLLLKLRKGLKKGSKQDETS